MDVDAWLNLNAGSYRRARHSDVADLIFKANTLRGREPKKDVQVSIIMSK